jgi:iron complex transport system ATP-binding protein
MRLNASETAFTSMLRCEAVRFSYGRDPVLRGIDLTVRPGEMVGVLGPNGAGKSTLIKLASGVVRPDAGRIMLGGEDVQRMARAEVARRVAVVPQDFTVEFAYTVRQIVEMGRMPYTGTWGVLGARDHTAVDSALAETGLASLANRIFSQLSGGERQRVLVALALAQSSALILLDEPTAHLDVRHQVEVLNLLRRFNAERGITVIAAMHDLNLAARYFPRLVLLHHEIVADGTPAAVLDAALLSRLYQTPVQVGILRGEEHLSVLPPAHAHTRASAPIEDLRARIHVIAGGGSGELVMRALADASIPFTAGALNDGDSDAALAARLAAVVVREMPYAPLGASALTESATLIGRAHCVVVCPTAFGPGNVALLDVALKHADGRRVILYEPDVVSADTVTDVVARRDFTGGTAQEAYAQLLARGAVVAVSLDEVLRYVASNNSAAHSQVQATPK